MYFNSLIEEKYKNEDIIMFVDMDGVIADFNPIGDYDYRNKRPLKNNIKVFEKISRLKNVELRILSICHTPEDINDKNNWLDENASFFEKDKRIIIAREQHNNTLSKDLKYNFIEEFMKTCNKKVVFIDDDNVIVKMFKNSELGIDIYQDSILVD